jgi:hypothetical protein
MLWLFPLKEKEGLIKGSETGKPQLKIIKVFREITKA